jgi:hypothetical protein
LTKSGTTSTADSLCEKTTLFLKNMVEQQHEIDSLQRELNKRTTAFR